MTLSEELKWRGFVNQTTFTDITELDKEPRTFYLGIDPSASSMTIGNLAVVMMVRHFISHGHKAVLLVGGATGMIGDPDGKKQERDLLTLEQIDTNKKAIAAQYQQILGDLQFEVVDNYDWFKDMGYLQFLRDVGKHVPMRVMLGREFVQSRLGEDGVGISYAEFSYSLIQGYDFVHLFRDKGVSLQICGADQWGNSIAGVDLIRRIEGAEAHVWSAPLVINKTTGVKFGKSEDGAVWLDPDLTSAYKFYQFWLNVDDEGAGDYLKIYTTLSKEEIEKILVEFEHDRASRLAQKTLAYEVTKLVHGEAAANGALSATEVLFGKGEFTKMAQADKELLKAELPTAPVDENKLAAVLVAIGLATSTSEARRFVESGAVSVNGTKVIDSSAQLPSGDNLVKRGKNNFAVATVA
jgi:tyrosyl-tRNA synthetase